MSTALSDDEVKGSGCGEDGGGEHVSSSEVVQDGQYERDGESGDCDREGEFRPIYPEGGLLGPGVVCGSEAHR